MIFRSYPKPFDAMLNLLGLLQNHRLSIWKRCLVPKYERRLKRIALSVNDQAADQNLQVTLSSTLQKEQFILCIYLKFRYCRVDILVEGSQYIFLAEILFRFLKDSRFYFIFKITLLLSCHDVVNKQSTNQSSSITNHEVTCLIKMTPNYQSN